MTLFLDAVDGKLVRSFNKESLKAYSAKRFDYQLDKEKLKSIKTVAPITTDGIEISLFANIGSSSDVKGMQK